MSILAEIERYQYNIDPSDLHLSTEALIRIINRILTDENSVLSQEVSRPSPDNTANRNESFIYGFQKVQLLFQITQRSLTHWSKTTNQPYKHLALSSLVVDVQELQHHSGDSITHSLQISADDST